jgi:hypothetical protein
VKGSLSVLKYAAGVVVILMGSDAEGTASAGRAIAAALGWPFAERGDPYTLHAVVARAAGRREPLIATSLPLDAAAQQTVRGELHAVRFVDLEEHGADALAALGFIRREFGV